MSEVHLVPPAHPYDLDHARNHRETINATLQGDRRPIRDGFGGWRDEVGLSRPCFRTRKGDMNEPFVAYHSIVLGCVVMPIVLGSYISSQFSKRLSAAACLPSGELAIPGTISIWDIRFILSITAGFGSMPFSVAKAIDLAWDLIVGRGGQLLLAWIAYRVFSRLIVHAMELDGISCEAYAAVAFQTGSLRFTWITLRDFVLRRYPRSWYGCATYACMVLTGIYILAFPTLASAMISYGPVSNAQVTSRDVTSKFTDWVPVWGVIRDGSRVGLQDNHTVLWNSSEISNISRYYDDHRDQYCHDQNTYNVSIDLLQAHILHGTGLPKCSNATMPDMFDSTSKIFLGEEHNLPSPILDLVNFHRHGTKRSKEEKNPWIWIYNKDDIEEIVTRDELLDDGAGACTPTKQYQWGFSFLLLFVTTVLNAVVFLALHVLYLYTNQESWLGKTGRQQPSIWRAVVDLGNVAMAAEEKGMMLWTTDRLEKEMKGQKMTLRLGEWTREGKKRSVARRSGQEDYELQPLRQSFSEREAID